MKKLLYFIIILIILGGGYYFYAQKNRQAIAPGVENGQVMKKEDGRTETQTAPKNQKADSSSTGTNLTPSPLPEGEGEKKDAQGTFSSGEEGAGMAPDVLVVQIDYDGNKFTPSPVEIKAGDIIIFKNNSSAQMWPASAPHPIHTDYAEFDAKQGIDQGSKWQFKFEKAGKWRFHDHLNPSAFGVVNVSAK